MLTATMRIAYAQVDSFLSILEEKYVEMIPRNIRYFFKQEMDTSYNMPIVTDVPIKNQNLTDEALALIAYLNLNYWCQDEKEKDELRKRYIQNQERYDSEVINNKYGAENIFKSEDKDCTCNSEIMQEDNIGNEEDEMILYNKDNIFRKIWLKIKSKFL